MRARIARFAFDRGGLLKAVVPLPPDTRQPLFDSQCSIDKSAPFDPMASFGSGMKRQGGNRGILLIAVGGAAVAAIAVIAVIATQGGEKKVSAEQPTVATNPTPAPGHQAGRQRHQGRGR